MVVPVASSPTVAVVSPGVWIKRVTDGPHGTFGVLMVQREGVWVPFCVTLEDPWRYNEPNVSCIPEGEYRCTAVNSPRFGHTYTVLGVPGRDLIRFHWGNTHKDTQGCILLGEGFMGRGGAGIVGSRAAFTQFLVEMKRVESFQLLIQNTYATP